MPGLKDTTELSPGMNLRESLVLFLKTGIEEMNNLINDKRGIDDPDIIHDLRVSARRLQTLFEAIGDILPADILRKAKLRVKDIIKTLGKARENDVSIELIDDFSKKHKKQVGRDTLLLLTARLKKNTIDERKKAISNSNVFNDVNYLYNTLLNEVTALKLKSFRTVPTLRISKDLKANGLLVIPRVFDKMISSTGVDDKQPDNYNSEELHKMRIKAKPVRYSMEFFRAVYGNEFAELTKEMKRFVEILGDLHDRDVLIEQLTDFMGEIEIYNTLNKKTKLDTRFIKKFIKYLQNERKIMFFKVNQSLSAWLEGKFRERLILSMN